MSFFIKKTLFPPSVQARLEADIDRDEEYLRDLSLTQDKSWRKEEMHQQLTQEQDQLKVQLIGHRAVA